jgi:hypothetical protein
VRPQEAGSDRKVAMLSIVSRSLGVALLFMVLCTAGCAGRTSVLPNSDPALRKPSTYFAADAAKRHPYPIDAPKAGDALARAQVGYTMNKIELLNLSDEDFKDIDVWVNQKYVVHIPNLKAKRGRVTSIDFQMLYDDKGNYFPTSNIKTLVNTVEIHRDGKMYKVPLQLAD